MPHRSQRRPQAVARARSAQARQQDPERLRASLAALAAGRHAIGSGGDVARLQRLVGNTAVRQLLAGGAVRGTAPPIVQRFQVGDMKQELGSELREKHVGTEAMPDVASPDGREEAVAAVYYQRAKADRRSMNTVFFADPAVLFKDLSDTNAGQELRSGPDYTTTGTYPAITVLVVGTVDKNSSGGKVKGAVTGPFRKLEIQHGEAKPMVRINKDHGDWAFNHLQQTTPKVLAGTADLLKTED
jgi:hypothetical protein